MLATLSTVSAVRERFELLTRLYAEQQAIADNPYLQAHAAPAAITHHVNVFEWYAPCLEEGTTILDWGSSHGPDSCLLRHRFGEQIDLHACDFTKPEEFAAFRDYARPRYMQLTDNLHIDYPNDTFDSVIGSGVLEHTAMEGESLKELYRILRGNGLLVITYLPYAYSLDEWRLRRTRTPGYHRRRFTRNGFAQLLLSYGFEPLTIEFQGLVPHKLNNPKYPVARQALAAVLPPSVKAFLAKLHVQVRYPFFKHSVLCAIARKMHSM